MPELWYPPFEAAPRRAIQIAQSSIGGHGQFPQVVTTALCDDGTIWELWDAGPEKHWVRLPSIPQDNQPKDPTP